MDEGLWLRQAGITLPILKFSPTLEDEEAAVAAGLTLGVGDEASIRRISVAGVAAGKTAEVHLKVDTGMHRFGAAVDDAPGLSRLIESLPNIALTGLFTHLPVSDVPDGEAFTHHQLERFRILADEIRRIASGELIVHAANSGAVLCHDLSGTDMVRPGIMLYGVLPDPQARRSVAIRPALSTVSSSRMLSLLTMRRPASPMRIVCQLPGSAAFGQRIPPYISPDFPS